MWKTATFALVFAAITCLILTEIVRSVLHRRRKQREGLGGTQDIAMWGTLIGWLLFLGAGICGLLWLFAR